jgi:hypothetical protein
VRHRPDRPCASDSRRSDDSIVPRWIAERFRVVLLVWALLRSDGGEDRLGVQSELFIGRSVKSELAGIAAESHAGWLAHRSRAARTVRRAPHPPLRREARRRLRAQLRLPPPRTEVHSRRSRGACVGGGPSPREGVLETPLVMLAVAVLRGHPSRFGERLSLRRRLRHGVHARAAGCYNGPAQVRINPRSDAAWGDAGLVSVMRLAWSSERAQGQRE